MHSDSGPTGFKSFLSSDPSVLPARTTKLRFWLLSFAFLLALSGVWLLLPEILRPTLTGLPLERNKAIAAAKQPAALLAAKIAQIRGDLWSEAALADASLLWLDRSAIDRAATARIDRARSYAERGLALAPINSDAWLFLAALPSTSTGADNRVGALLEMSYFTSPDDLTLAPLRLERAATSNALADKDLQEFVKSDMRRIWTFQPQMKSAIVTAYRLAWPQNQPLMEALATEVDPALGQLLRAGTPK